MRSCDFAAPPQPIMLYHPGKIAAFGRQTLARGIAAVVSLQLSPLVRPPSSHTREAMTLAVRRGRRSLFWTATESTGFTYQRAPGRRKHCGPLGSLLAHLLFTRSSRPSGKFACCCCQVVGFPATPLLTSRARICISAAHTRSDLDAALAALEEVADECSLRYTVSGVCNPCVACTLCVLYPLC